MPGPPSRGPPPPPPGPPRAAAWTRRTVRLGLLDADDLRAGQLDLSWALRVAPQRVSRCPDGPARSLHPRGCGRLFRDGGQIGSHRVRGRGIGGRFCRSRRIPPEPRPRPTPSTAGLGRSSSFCGPVWVCRASRCPFRRRRKRFRRFSSWRRPSCGRSADLLDIDLLGQSRPRCARCRLRLHRSEPLADRRGEADLNHRHVVGDTRDALGFTLGDDHLAVDAKLFA